MDIRSALKLITDRHNLTSEQMHSVMQEIMTGMATPAQIAGFLIALRMKGETVEEITAAAKVMRSLAIPVHIQHPHLVDIVGTGGDSQHTFNVSTTSAFVVAAAGGCVAKHGNRSVSSQSGSADALEALGVKIDLTVQQVTRCLHELNIGFLFAPQHHTAMKHAIGARREMGVRTIFNLLGPLTNPAFAPHQLLGVYSLEWIEPLAHVMKQLGSEHILIVHSQDGLDEISVSAPTFVAELAHGEIRTYTLIPEEFNLQYAPLESIQVKSIAESVAMMRRVLANEACPARDIVCLNAGAAIYAANLVPTLAAGIERAHAVIANGAAQAKVDALVQLTQSFAV